MKILNKKNKSKKKLSTIIIKFFVKYLMVALNISFRATIKGFTSDQCILFKNRKKIKIINFISLSIILILSYFNIAWVKLIFFFTLKGFILMLHNSKQNIKLLRIKQKYKRLSHEFFDNKLEVVYFDNEKITIISNELTIEDIIKSKSKFELFFNRKISFIKNQQKNLRYIDLYFSKETKFKDCYPFEEYINKIDEKEIKNKSIPAIIGVDERENITIIDFAKVKNLFIAGEPGGGKSVLTNVVIQSLMILNNNIMFIMVDLKEGVELSDYDNFRNTIVVSNTKELCSIINKINEIMIDRLQKIRKTDNCKNYFDYNNKKNTENMFEIFLIIDELAEIKLNSSSKGRSEEETQLLQIGQKARAAGIYIVGATQRPSGEQINTDFRAIFQKAISFCISTKETQRMTKVPDTEKLKPGEFKTNIWNQTSRIYKAFLVDSKHNKIYYDLKHVLKDEKILINILEKKKTKHYNLFQRIVNKFNKGYDKKLVQDFSWDSYLKTVPNTVKMQISEIKKLVQNDNNSIEKPQIKHGDNYFLLLKFLLENKQENNLIPASNKIIKSLKLSERKKKELLTKALEENYIKKRGKTRFEINYDCKKWNDIKESIKTKPTKPN
ncbi:MAG: FtsK/SpoIIIE domain-containing protein [Ignavibacteria bacterium]